MMQFPTNIPVRIPWQPHEWQPVTIADLTEDERFLDFITQWQSELKQRPGAPKYLEFVLAHCGYRTDSGFSAESLISLLWKTVELVSKEPIAVAHPVAAFELVSTLDGFAEFALDKLPKKAKKHTEDARTGVSGSVIIFAYQALRSHFEEASKKN